VSLFHRTIFWFLLLTTHDLMSSITKTTGKHPCHPDLIGHFCFHVYANDDLDDFKLFCSFEFSYCPVLRWLEKTRRVTRLAAVLLMGTMRAGLLFDSYSDSLFGLPGLVGIRYPVADPPKTTRHNSAAQRYTSHLTIYLP